MKKTASLGFMGTIVTFILVLATIAVSLPLIIFSVETYEHPEIIQVKASASPVNRTHLNVTITIVYGGSVPLKNFSIKINNTWYDIGTVTRGETVYTFIVKARPVRITAYSFSIGGLYPVEIGVASNG